MASQNLYDDEFLYNLANNLEDELKESQNQEEVLENAQNFASEEKAGNANETKEETVQNYDIEALNLSSKEKTYLNELDEAVKNIATMSDSEVKKLYNDLKVKFYADKTTKKQFKQSQKIVKAMIKSDKKRTNLRFITKAGKYTSILSVVAGIYYGLVSEFEFLNAYRDPYMNFIEYLNAFLELNKNYYFAEVPEAEIIAGAFALGVAGYVAGKGLVKLDDLKTLRRLMVQVCAEEMTISELQSLKNAVKVKGNGVKEAMITYPLRDYGKSTETIAQEKWMKLQERIEEEEKKKQENANEVVSQNVNEDLELSK